MQNLKYIKKFSFGSARYTVSDGQDEAYLDIDYENNKYKVAKRVGETNGELKKEAEKVAQKLLKRKHGVNFADKLRI